MAQGDLRPTELVEFMTGNPQLGMYSGSLEYLRNDEPESTERSLKAELPQYRTPWLCMTSIAAHMVPTDMLQFLAPVHKDILQLRILRPCRASDAMEYMVLLYFCTQVRPRI